MRKQIVCVLAAAAVATIGVAAQGAQQQAASAERRGQCVSPYIV